MKKLALFFLVLSFMIMAGCGPVQQEQPVETAGSEQQGTVPATVPEESALGTGAAGLVCGVSTMEDILGYYQQTLPQQKICVEFCDLDGNGWEDLAVWYDHAFRALYLMEKDDVLGAEILFERGFQLLEYWQDGVVCGTNIIGTIEEEAGATVYKYFDVKNGGLSLRASLKYDGTDGQGKCFAFRGETWVPITDETYRRELGNYFTKPDQLRPIEELVAVSEDADVVLKTMEMALEDGRVLTLRVMGKQQADSQLYGVREILVNEGDQVLQSILIEEAIRAEGVDGVDKGYSESHSAETAAGMKDVNFDGIPDIEVCGWLPNNSIPYYYWCWDANMQQFTYAFCLQLTEVDHENRELISWYKVENGLYYIDHYIVNARNELELVERHVEDVRTR